ncbi:MAG: EAL domain-containing protein [Thermaceae bacterium]|nr:EAL domain-containing protein [Thermaceae bacterium]
MRRYQYFWVWMGAFVFLLAVTAIVRLVLEPSYLTLEAREVQNTLQRGQGLLLQNLKALESTTQDYAWWDDADRFVKGENPNFIADNFTADSLRNLHVEAIAFFSPTGKLLHASQLWPQDTRLSTPGPLTLQTLQLYKPGNGLHSTAGMLQIAGQVYLAVSSPVLPTSRSGTPVGYLVMTRRIDGPLLESLSQVLGSRMSLRPTAEPAPALQILGPNAVLGSLPLHDLNGQTIAQLEVHLPRPVYAQMHQTTDSFMVALVLLALLTAGLLHYLLMRLEATQISHLENARRYIRQVEQLAFYDPLTGLANRRLLYQRGQDELAAAQAIGKPLSLLYLDLDRFKSINDALGHDVGDELLCKVTERLSQCVRPGDTLARLGGDEFALLLPQSHEAEAKEVAQRLIEALGQSFRVGEHRLNVGVSVGIASYPEHGNTLGELLQAADTAMYRAKALGSGFALYHPDHNPYSPERLELENDLLTAVRNNLLTLHYQPVLDLRVGQLEGYEALVRWVRKDSEVSPGLFIPLAEEGNLIYTLDQRVLEHSLSQLRSWTTQGLNPQLSVNLSTQSLHREGLTQQVEALITEFGVDPSRVMLEITETALVADLSRSQAVIRDFQAMGLRIAIDDFGSGYASLGYLRHLPVHRLKIDKSLVWQIGHSRRDEKLLAAILELGHSLDLEVLAEGVETLDQLEWLRTQGFDYAQGFLIGKPLPPSIAPTHLGLVSVGAG